MNWLMPITTTATEMQRNYKKVRNWAKKAKVPVMVLANSKPDLVVMDYDVFNRMTKKGNIEAAFGIWTKEEADEFDRVIEEAFERVNPEDWR